MPLKREIKDRLYELLIENAREYAIFITDLNGDIIDWSPGAQRMFGYSADEAVGQPCALIFTPEDRAAHVPDRERQRATETGQSSDERWHLRKDGSRLFVIGFMFALRDEQRQLAGFGKIIRDRTEERRLEADLRRSEERLRIALAAARIGIWEYDLVSGLLYWSDEAKVILGLSPEAKESTDLFLSCVHPEERDATRLAIEQALRAPGEHSARFRVLHPDGSIHHLAARAYVSFTREGEQPFCDRVYGTLVDVTERENWTRQLEKAVADATTRLQEKVLQLETLCYAIAHNFRAPIRTIEGFAGVLQNDYNQCLDDPGRDYLHRIFRAAEQMDQLVSDLLAYGGGMIRALRQAPVDANRALADVLSTLRDVVAEANARVDTDTLQPVLGDEDAVKTVLHALLSNALKFTRPNVLPLIRVHAETVGSSVRTIVTDNGVGIAQHYRDKVFELFHRFDRHDVRATGMGLSLARALVERMHGRMGFESEPGKGSRFWFELPRA